MSRSPKTSQATRLIPSSVPAQTRGAGGRKGLEAVGGRGQRPMMAAMMPSRAPLAAPGSVSQTASQPMAAAVIAHTAHVCPPTNAKMAISQNKLPNT